jgi:hypothetical protein
MNFVSQFGAVLLAHQAIAEKGPSLALLGALVRGYANLTLLTEHYMSSQQEAFAARSLLYAERMLQLSDNSTLARWHRAYALSVIGIQGVALDEIGALTQEASKKSPAAEAPTWTKLLGPYCRFQQDEIAKTAAADKSLSELAALLQWQIYRCYYHGRWIYEKGNETVKSCPEL